MTRPATDQQTVQNAFREVHDALVTNRSAAEVLTAESARREQLQQALAVAGRRLEPGRIRRRVLTLG